MIFLPLTQLLRYLRVIFTYTLSSIDNVFFLVLLCNKEVLLDNHGRKFIFPARIISDICDKLTFDEDFRKFYMIDRNLFFLKFYFLWRKNNLISSESNNKIIKIGKKSSNIYDTSWLAMFRFCNNFLFDFFMNNFKLLILDLDYKNSFFFTSSHFDINNVSSENSLFFPNVKDFSKKK
jgi:hypothetical protein